MSRRGVLYGVVAYALWGLVPLYWALVDRAGEVELLAHRVVWSLVIVAALLSIGNGVRVLRTLSARTYGLFALAAVVISANWGLYIWGVVNGHVIETSLGYFINPLVTVVLGVVVLHERLRPAQWAAIGLAAVAVVILTIDYGRPPWLALVLAFSFGTYGLIKKKANTGAAESLGVETAILFAPALAFLIVLQVTDRATFGQHGIRLDLLMIAAGAVTAIPLLFFAAAATRVPLTTLGLLQYLAPTIQFILGVTVFGEDVPPMRLAGFAIVWTALAILTTEALAHRRSVMRAVPPTSTLDVGEPAGADPLPGASGPASGRAIR
jgi:chloramphenicol-sensitive protein RarD